MPRIPLAIAFFGLLGLVACPKPSTDPGGQGPGGNTATVPGGAVDPGATDPADPNASTPPTAGGCLSDADCDGGVCEGQGCGDDQPGTCAPQGRMCTRDSVAYCGCDGNTFRSSGSCPGKRYASKGECGGKDPNANAGRSPCLAPSDCDSGICEGQGCSADEPGTCAPKGQMCTRDLRAYCGCDGTTFRASGSCPGQRYAARGECEPKSGA